MNYEGKRDVGPKSPLLELAQRRAAVTGEGDRRPGGTRQSRQSSSARCIERQRKVPPYRYSAGFL